MPTMIAHLLSALLIAGLFTLGSRLTVSHAVRNRIGTLFVGSLTGSFLAGLLASTLGEPILLALAFATGGLLGGVGLVVLRKPNHVPLFDGDATASPDQTPPERDVAALIAVSFYIWLLVCVLGVLLLQGASA